MKLDMLTVSAPKPIHIGLPVALDRALQRAFPETAERGFAEWRAHQAILSFLRERGIEITAEVAAAVSHRQPARRSPARHAPRAHGRRRRR